MNYNSTVADPPASSSSKALTASVDGPRKHRRPALSCIQCRRRKVKCDRNAPCNRCTQSKNTACIYDPEIPTRTTNRKTKSSLNYTSSSSTQNKMQVHEIPAAKETFHSSSLLSGGPSAPVAHSPAPSVTWGTAPLLVHSQSEKHKLDGTIGPGNLQPEASIQDLKDRIQKLETMLSNSSHINRTVAEIGSSGIVPAVPRLQGGGTKKMRFFGLSHWMNIKKEFELIHSLKYRSQEDRTSGFPKLLKKCKELARIIKAERPGSFQTLPDFGSYIPPREVSDQLVQSYFRVFESTHRILHRRIFLDEYEQYWSKMSASSTGFIIKLLLVMAIGTIFGEEVTNGIPYRSLAPQWVFAAQTWIGVPFEKARLNIEGIEIQCLLILARQALSLGADLLWIAVGSLLRSGMSVGLHRDPSHFPKMTIFHAEMRRRLWATIIELAVQFSLDCGMAPMLSFDDFDCEPPSNYDDADIDERSKDYSLRKEDSIFTQSSIQITLRRSLRTRLEICRSLNDFRSNLPYEQVLALGTELISHIRSHGQLQNMSQSSKAPFTATQKNMLDLLTRRFLLALHLPFTVQAKTDPHFYFSRKIALDSGMTILTYPEGGDSVDDFTRIKLISGGCYHETFSRAWLAVSLELINQINEDFSLNIMPGPSTGSVARKPLHEAVDFALTVVKRRVELGETNVKGYLFLSMVQAQTTAMEKGENPIDAITKRAKQAAEEAYDLLRKQLAETPTTMDVSTPASARFSAGERAGDIDIDWDVLMQDTTMEFDISNTWLFDTWDDAQNIA